MTGDLRHLILSIDKMEKGSEELKGLEGVKKITLVYPGTFVLDHKINKTRKLATLQVLPTHQFLYNQGADESCEVTMQKEKGILEI